MTHCVVFLCFLMHVLLAEIYCIFLWLHLLVLDLCFLSTSQEISWAESLENDLFCVEWDVKTLTQSTQSTTTTTTTTTMTTTVVMYYVTRMWAMPNVMVALPSIAGASVQRRKVCLTPTTRCCAVTLPRRETRRNLQGCRKLPNRSQPLVGRSSSYCGDMCRRYVCMYVCILRAGVQPTLDPYNEAFIAGPLR